MKLRLTEEDRLAWELHRQNGHPEGYEGPCWGPTPAEREEVRNAIGVGVTGEHTTL